MYREGKCKRVASKDRRSTNSGNENRVKSVDRRVRKEEEKREKGKGEKERKRASR